MTNWILKLIALIIPIYTSALHLWMLMLGRCPTLVPPVLDNAAYVAPPEHGLFHFSKLHFPGGCFSAQCHLPDDHGMERDRVVYIHCNLSGFAKQELGLLNEDVEILPNFFFLNGLWKKGQYVTAECYFSTNHLELMIRTHLLRYYPAGKSHIIYFNYNIVLLSFPAEGSCAPLSHWLQSYL